MPGVLSSGVQVAHPVTSLRSFSSKNHSTPPLPHFAVLSVEPGWVLDAHSPDADRSNCRALVKSDAVLRIADTLESPFPELATVARLVPWFIRDNIYDLIAANRYRIFGESSTCRLSDPKEAARFISE
jgi:predicted DCC family thiol-disulfide oxidoreductase YuxK